MTGTTGPPPAVLRAATPDDEQTRWWVEHVVLPEHDVRLLRDAVTGCPLGFSAAADPWLEHLYVAPGAHGRGHGGQLLEAVLLPRPPEVLLHVFRRNTGARRFYERHGFRLVSTSDGSRNEEREPDATYRWSAGDSPST